jgi:hypothetical protein
MFFALYSLLEHSMMTEKVNFLLPVAFKGNWNVILSQKKRKNMVFLLYSNTVYVMLHYFGDILTSS